MTSIHSNLPFDVKDLYNMRVSYENFSVYNLRKFLSALTLFSAFLSMFIISSIAERVAYAPGIIDLSQNKEDLGNSYCPYDILRKIKKAHTDQVIIGHLNINSLRNKFNSFQFLIKNQLDIICLTEIKLDQSFPKIHSSLKAIICIE